MRWPSSCAAIISVSLWNLKQFFDDKYDKNNFIKNILFDNILPSDVYAKSKDLGFTSTLGALS